MGSGKLLFIIGYLCFAYSITGHAQDADKAESDFNVYVAAVRSGSPTQEAYEALVRSAKEYLAIHVSNPSESSVRIKANQKLQQMIGPLQSAIMFFNKNNYTTMMMTAARTYVDATNACPSADLNSNHIPIVRLVAINTANQVIINERTIDGYQKVIPYLQTYIATNDQTSENRIEQAYTQLGKCCTEIKDYAQAYKVLKQGLARFPDDENMPRLMVHTLQHIGNKKDELIEYLQKALTIKPDDAELLRVLARQYQNMSDNTKAAEVLEKLHKADPYQKDYTRNLAYSYFSIGLDLMDSIKTQKKKSVIKELKTSAETKMRAASTLLEELMVDEFSENEQLKYAQALATIYAYVNESKKEDEINNKLKDAGLQKLDARVALADLNDSAPVNRSRVSVTQSSYGNTMHTVQNTSESSIQGDDVKNCDVDVNLPLAETENPKNFVVIIANEKYQEVENVEFANNDGNKFREYCLQTLGIPESHIYLAEDATLGQMKRSLNWLRQGTVAFDNANVIFYYAGHGMPDEKSGTSYLVPVDGIANDTETNYSLEKLYAELGALKCDRVCVFMDACFSGSKRGEGMLSSSRGLAQGVKKEEPKGRIIIISAAQGDETAYPYKEKKHGLFTYYLLKKLQDSGEKVTLGELADYIKTNVKKTSFEQNQKLQTPDVTPAFSFGDEWTSYPLISTIENDEK